MTKSWGRRRAGLEPAPEPVIEPIPPPIYPALARSRPQTPAAEEPEAVLDPYSVYQQGGSNLLLKELSARSAGHLRQIIHAHLRAEQGVVPETMNRGALIALITERVRATSRSSNRQ